MRILNGKSISRREVAAAAGVSDAMVSYAFSSTTKVKIKASTRERIKRVAQELGYRPNSIGRALVNGCSYNIGMLLPEKCMSTFIWFHLHIFQGICAAVNDTEYNLSVFFGANEKYYRKLMEGGIDGLVILDSLSNLDFIEKSLDFNLPTVLTNIDYNIDNSKHPKLATVRSDHEQFIGESVRYLIDKGCKKILHINDYDTSNPNQIMVKSFNDTCEQYIDQGIIGTTMKVGNHYSQYKPQFSNMLATGLNYDAFLVDGANKAVMLIKLAAEHNLQPGQDFEIIVSDTMYHDNLGFSSHFYIQEPELVGRTAGELIYKILRNQPHQNKIKIPYTKKY